MSQRGRFFCNFFFKWSSAYFGLCLRREEDDDKSQKSADLIKQLQLSVLPWSEWLSCWSYYCSCVTTDNPEQTGVVVCCGATAATYHLPTSFTSSHFRSNISTNSRRLLRQLCFWLLEVTRCQNIWVGGWISLSWDCTFVWTRTTLSYNALNQITKYFSL